MHAAPHAVPRLGLALAPVLGMAALLACSSGTPVWCATGLPDGGCSYHVEVHCGGAAACSPGGTQVLDAGSCVRDVTADALGC